MYLIQLCTEISSAKLNIPSILILNCDRKSTALRKIGCHSPNEIRRLLVALTYHQLMRLLLALQLLSLLDIVPIRVVCVFLTPIDSPFQLKAACDTCSMCSRLKRHLFLITMSTYEPFFEPFPLLATVRVMEKQHCKSDHVCFLVKRFLFTGFVLGIMSVF